MWAREYFLLINFFGTKVWPDLFIEIHFQIRAGQPRRL
jgi:hypothetical protein